MRKSGKKIKQSFCTLAPGVKRPTFELSSLAALVAMQNNVFTDTHNAALYVLADICTKFNRPQHIQTHSDALKRIVEELHQADYKGSSRWHPEAVASVNILLEFIKAQKNLNILKVAKTEIDRIEHAN
jgi:hypothetical protein